MGVISKDQRKITIYYHSETSIGKQTFAYVKSSDKKLHEVDIAKNNVPGTQWVELAKGLGKELSELIDTNHPDFVDKYGKQVPRLEEHDWLKILENEPHLVKKPIVIYGEEFLQIESAAEFKQYIEADTENIDKQPSNQ